MLVSLTLLVGKEGYAQFNPSNPPEPGVTYKVSVNAIPANGGSVSGSGKYSPGSNVTIQAWAQTGYVFERWENGQGEEVSRSATYSFKMENRNIAFTARFRYSPSNPSEPSSPSLTHYSEIKISSDYPSGGYFSGAGRYAVGESVRISASLNSGFRLVEWKLGEEVVSTSTSFYYVVREGDNNLHAHLEYSPGNPSEPSSPKQTRRLTLKMDPSSAGSFNIGSGNRYAPGESVYLNCYLYTGYKFKEWTDKEGKVVSTSQVFYYVMPDHDAELTCTAVFSPDNPADPGAQDPRRNIIFGSRRSVVPGTTVYYGVSLENIDEVNGVTVDISFPEGYEADFNGIVLTERTSGQTLDVQTVDARTKRVILRGTTSFAGGNGEIFRIPVAIPLNAVPGESLTVQLSKGVTYFANGSQSPCDTADGIIKIAEEEIALPDSPDFTVRDISMEGGSLMPGDTVNVGWKVENSGIIAGLSGWSETVNLVSTTGRICTLGKVYYDTDHIAPSESVARNATFTIPPLPGLDGEIDIRVTVTPYASSGEIEELQTNNTLTTTDHPISLGKILALSMPESVTEGTDHSIRVLLSRSGDWTDSETFNISSDNNRLRIPQNVTIPKGMSGVYFIINLDDNNALDDIEATTLKISGNNYPEIEQIIAVVDDEYPDISLEFADESITEGESTTLTITLPRPTKENLEISIACDVNGRFDFPAKATVPAGETTSMIEVLAIDNDRIENNVDATFSASAPHYGKGEEWLEVLDNDMPRLSLTLTPMEVSEGAGPRAIRGTLKRTSNTDKSVTIVLSDDHPGQLIYSNKISLAPGVTETDFNIGIVDNNRAEGDRTVNLTAAVYLQTCSCSAAVESGGAVDREITIIDNDGPSLSVTISNATLLKNKPESQLTLSRNTSSAESLEVTLSATPSGLLDMPASIVIPAGSESVTVPVVAKAEAFTGVEKEVILNVEAPGFSKGTSLLLISDRNLPDAVVSLNAGNVEVLPGNKIVVTAVVGNEGNMNLPDAAAVDIYLDNSSESLATLHTTRALAPGETESLTYELNAPVVPGNYRLTAHVNDGAGFPEMTRTNNVSEAFEILVVSPFTASVSIDREDLLPGETLTIHGNVQGYRENVEVFYILDGARFTKTATPDSSGDFTLEITPLYAGDYTLGVCVPDENKSEGIADFSVRGIQTDNSGHLLYDINAGDTKALSLRLTNRSKIPVGNLKVSSPGLPEDCELKISAPASIGANATVDVRIEVTGKRATEGNSWLNFPIEITGDNVEPISKTAFLFCHANMANLVASVSNINTTMTMGSDKIYRLAVANNGKGDTGDISLSLPAFMQKGTPLTLPSISYGEVVNIDIMMTPAPEMQLNVPVTGRIGINCANGDGIAIPYSVEPVSESTGVLVVDVKDEYTFATAEAPHVEGASVIISHPVSGKLIAKGLTNGDGLYTMTLPEGMYAIEVSATNHGVYKNNIQVDPGKENLHPVFIPFEAISYDWRVEETTVDDTYEIVTTVEFETRVPKPVVVVDFPKLSWKNQIAYISITNKGLITATNIDVQLPEPADGISLEMIGDRHIPVLLAGENRMVPIRVRVEEEDLYPDLMLTVSSYSYTGSYIGEDSARAPRRAKSSSGCVSLPCKITVDDPDCDPLTGEPIYGKTKEIDGTYRVGNCGHPGSWPPGTRGNIGGSIGWGAPGGLSLKVPLPPVGNKPTDKLSTYYADRVLTILTTGCLSDCEKALADALKACWDALAECKGLKPDSGVRGCIEGLIDNCNPSEIDDIHDGISCGGAIGGCIPGGGCPSAIVECFNKAWKAFEECMKAKKAQKKSPKILNGILRVPEEDTEDVRLEASEKRAQTVLLYFELLSLMDSNKKNLLGEGNWSRMTGNEYQSMIAWLNDHLDSEGYMPSGDKALEAKPATVDTQSFISFIERYNNSVRYQKTGVKSENMFDYNLANENAVRFNEISDTTKEMGFPDGKSFAQSASDNIDHLLDLAEEPSEGVCSSITLKFSQTMVMTRQAFRGTLTIQNGNDEVAMTDIKLNVRVRDEEGNLVGQREFAVQPESITGFDGTLDLSSGWSLSAGSTGEATILFVPSKYAAPVEPRVFSFGGVLSYIDPFNGLEVSRELSPIDMTVTPSPLLDMHYFMQRDVMGDDALTPDRIEPSEEAEFALLINNKGFGDANNLRMMTRQPEIIDNSKGLSIDFVIAGSSLNGQRSSLSIGEKVPTEFGDLKALSTSYAQWWLKSSLMGHFKSYDVKATQISSYGSEDLSLLDKVEIHELIHGFTPEDGEGVSRAFLTNDIPDGDNFPDMIWFSDSGNALEVDRASDISITSNDDDTECLVNISASEPGWVYGNALTPWSGRRKITSVVRLSDGKQLPADNFWMTYVKLINSAAPKYEDSMHCAINLTSSSETYRITLEPKPDPELDIVSFSGIPENNTISNSSVEIVGVKFNKPIDASTFSADDISVTCQGSKLNVEASSITRNENDTDNTLFDIMLRNICAANGYYTLTVNLSGILDSEGFNGSQSRRAAWIQFANGEFSVDANVSPADAGDVTPAASKVKIGESVSLKATANEGYDFLKWTDGTQTLSHSEILTYTPVEDATVTAVFTLRRYNVNINYNEEWGTVLGAGTGMFDHGTKLNLLAVPAENLKFSHWENEAGEKISVTPSLDWIVKDHATLSPVFMDIPTGVDTTYDKGETTIYPVPVRDRLHISGNFTELRSIEIFAVEGSRCLTFKGYSPGTPVNVSALTPGLYVVRIATEKGISTHRLIKL